MNQRTIQVQNIITSILAFVATNIDDIFILMLLFGLKRIATSAIVIGQLLGITALVIVALLAAYAGNFIDQRFIGLLGLFPIYLAIRQTVDLFGNNDNDENGLVVKSSGILTVAGITIANGGDNLGVYAPLLSIMSAAERFQMITIFLLLTFLWCIIGKYLAERPLIARQLERFGHIIMPIVLFALGVFILIESETFSLLKSD